MTRKPPSAVRRARLCIEQLEDRTTPTPVLTYSTYINQMFINAQAVDSAGNAYLAGDGGSVMKLNPSGTGLVYSTQVTTSGVGLAITVDSAGDAYALFGDTGHMTVYKLDPTGTNVLYSMSIPGAAAGSLAYDGPNQAGIAVDSSGNIYITGKAGAGLPTTTGAYQATAPDLTNGSAFLCELNPNLSRSASIVYCTYLGGSGSGGNGDVGTGVAVDGAGNAYVSGYTASNNFPTTAGAFQTKLNGGSDVFAAKFNPALSGAASLVYSTYLGGSGNDGFLIDTLGAPPNTLFTPNGPAIAVDGSGGAYLTGFTDSADFPVTAGAFQTSSGIGSKTGGTAFVTKLNASGSGLVYSTFLGIATSPGKSPPKHTFGTAIAIDSAGDAYVTGMTVSKAFPLVNPVRATYGGSGDVFVSTLGPSGNSLLFSTYLGGAYSDVGMAIGLDAHNNTYVAGGAASLNFPVTPGAYQTSGTGVGSGFAAMIDPPVEASATPPPGAIEWVPLTSPTAILWTSPESKHTPAGIEPAAGDVSALVWLPAGS